MFLRAVMSIDNIKFRPPIPGNSSSSPSVVVGKETVNGQDTLLIADMTVQQLAIETLQTLKKIEYHLSLMTDADLTKGNL